MGSEYSSGCESGWTMYLEHSMNPSSSLRDPAAFLVDENNGNRERWRTVDHEMGGEEPEEEEEEEDNLSMVSDASSPNLQDQHQLGYLSFNPKTEEDFSPNMKKSTQKLHHQKKYNRHEFESTQFRDDTQMDCFLNNGYIPTPPKERFLQDPSQCFFQRDFKAVRLEGYGV